MPIRVVLVATLLLGSARAQDVVYYFDPAAKKELEYRGSIEQESPSGIKIRMREAKADVLRLVPTEAIRQVIYNQKNVDRLTYRTPFNKLERALRESGKAREKALQEAIEGFTKLEQQVTDSPLAKRYFQYKVAQATALLAQSDPTKMESALKLLSDFKALHPKGWQIVPALKTLARLYEESGNVDEARKSYETLADLSDVSPALKRESNLLVARLLLRSGKSADAERRLKAMAANLSKTDPEMPFVQLYLIQTQLETNKLEGIPQAIAEVVRSSADPKLRGTAYNLLGDYFLKMNQPEDAFWQYLRVDALYPNDREQRAKALYHLISLFDKVKKDPLRGKECAELLKEPQFAGTIHQRRILTERSTKQP